ncbi:hypothetical protein CHS0354_041467 [Potamilus streckersoni]|uniref:BTB domain-containing protein n=1 Tax=Potamilus streckersoni TaxID=2493646 RepID=A0AAE0TA11_9BIVA|nr:hypothetical protein CHS0354_041467 [Potamilus streckersoni]
MPWRYSHGGEKGRRPSQTFQLKTELQGGTSSNGCLQNTRRTDRCKSGTDNNLNSHSNHLLHTATRSNTSSLKSESHGNSHITKELDSSLSDMALSAVMISGGNLQRSSSHVVLNQNDPDSDSIDRNGSKCTCSQRETLFLNVGGQVFETYKSTLKRLKTFRLNNENELMKHFREDRGDFFFDRDPLAFSVILNYLRHGELHPSTFMCGPVIQREFQYWGIDELDIERCCWQPYSTWKTQTRSLEKLEYDRNQCTTQTDLTHDRYSKHCWRRCRAAVWTFLQKPTSSRAAKVYAWVSTLFVFMSIFSFCASTHPYFQLSPNDFVVRQFETLYRIFTLEDKIVFPRNRNASSTLDIDTLNISNTAELNFTSSQNSTADSENAKVNHPILLMMDVACVFYFTVEFIVRFIFSPKKFKFITSLQNNIDFVATLPDYLEFILMAIGPEERKLFLLIDFIFILRMLRLFRIFRLIRHVPGLWILLYTLKASVNELMLMFVFLLIGMVVFASLMHFAEGGEGYQNIPIGFWWAVVTMTTVGYGDMYPKTALGYVIGSVCAISGLLMIAFTVPIIVSNFVLYYTHVQYGISERNQKSQVILPVPEIKACSIHNSSVNVARSDVSISKEYLRDAQEDYTITDGNCNKV